MSGARRPQAAIIGAGRAGGALAILMRRAGYPVEAVWSRDGASARRVRRHLVGAAGGGVLATSSLQRALKRASLVLLAVPDGALATVAAKADPFIAAGATVLHLSGATGLEPLQEALSGSTRHAGSLHPLIAFPRRLPPPGDLAGALCAVDGDAPARGVAATLARNLGGRVVRIPPRSRATYHLAASLVANDSLALASLAQDLLCRIGLEENLARQGLATLLESTAAALRDAPPAESLTGPVARGDHRTLALHLGASRDPAVQTIHREASRVLLRLMRRSGRLSPAGVRRVRAVLAPRPSGQRPPDVD